MADGLAKVAEKLVELQKRETNPTFSGTQGFGFGRHYNLKENQAITSDGIVVDLEGNTDVTEVINLASLELASHKEFITLDCAAGFSS